MNVSASSACSAAGKRACIVRSVATSACTSSFWFVTDTYSPVPIENAPATRAATPVRMMAWGEAWPPPSDQRRVGHQPVDRPEHGRSQAAPGYVAMPVRPPGRERRLTDRMPVLVHLLAHLAIILRGPGHATAGRGAEPRGAPPHPWRVR